MKELDYTEWTRMNLPVPVVHFNTGPLAPAELGDWVLANVNRQPAFLVHPLLKRAHETAVAYLENLGPGKALLFSGNLLP